MSFSYGWRGPNIVKDGLVLYLDPGSPNSYYNKTGTTIKDISGNGNNGTLINFGSQTVYNPNDGGSIIFDGTDDYINMGDKDTFTQSSGFTFDVFFKPTTTNGNTILEKYQPGGLEYIFGFSGDKLYAWVSDNATGGGYRGRFVQTVSSYVTTNQWYQFVFTYDGGNTSSSCKLYINTIQRDDNDFQGGTFNSIKNTTTPLTIALTNSGLGAPIKGSLGTLKMYNRPLTQSEIQQNYNVTKQRFGL